MSYENIKNELDQQIRCFSGLCQNKTYFPSLSLISISFPLLTQWLLILFNEDHSSDLLPGKAFPGPLCGVSGITGTFLQHHPLQYVATCLSCVSCSPRTHKSVFLGTSHHLIFVFEFIAGIKKKFVDLWSRFLIMCQTLS